MPCYHLQTALPPQSPFGQGLPEDTSCPEVQRVLEGCDLGGTGRGEGERRGDGTHSGGAIRDGRVVRMQKGGAS